MSSSSSAARQHESSKAAPRFARAPQRQAEHFKAIEAWTSAVRCHPELTAPERLYLTTLVRRINAYNLAWPAYETVCAECGVSRSTGNRATRKAVELGLLEREARFERNGRQTSNRYRLVLPSSCPNPFLAQPLTVCEVVTSEPNGSVGCQADKGEVVSLTTLEASQREVRPPISLAAASKIDDGGAEGQRASAARAGQEVEASEAPVDEGAGSSTRNLGAQEAQGSVSEEGRDLVRCWHKLGIKAAPPSMRALSGYSTAELRTALLWFCSKLVAGKVYSPTGLFLHLLGCVHRGEKPIFDYSVGDIALVLEGHHPTELKQRRLALLEQAEREEVVQPAAPQPSAVTEAQPVLEYVKSRFAEGRVDEVVPEDAEGAMQALDLTKREGRRRAIHWAALLVIRKVLDMRQASELFTGVLSQQHSQAGRELKGFDRHGGYVEIENHAYELNVALGRVLRC